MKSRNEALDKGTTEGKYKDPRPNTEVAPLMGEEIVRANRAGLLADTYDQMEFAPTKVNPGSR